jgi:pantothenate kinase
LWRCQPIATGALKQVAQIFAKAVLYRSWVNRADSETDADLQRFARGTTSFPSRAQRSAARQESGVTMIIAIDGPAASGKGTIARQLAAVYGLHHLDTGLIYRAVA